MPTPNEAAVGKPELAEPQPAATQDKPEAIGATQPDGKTTTDKVGEQPASAEPAQDTPETGSPAATAMLGAAPLVDQPQATASVPLARKRTTTAPATGFDGSSRPAWTPMEIKSRPLSNRVTVLGMTLTWTQTVIAGAVVLVLLVLLILVIPKVFGGDDRNNDAAAPAPTAAGSKAPTKAPTTPAQQQPATTAPATPPVSSAPAPAAGGGTVSLPAGWTLYKDPTGFSVPIPSGASIERHGSEVYFRKNNRLLIVDQTDQPKPDPVADWKNQEAERSGRVYRNYQRIKIVPVRYFVKAADWEFTYTTTSGNPQHAVKRGVITSANQAYGISWYTSPGDWAAGLKDLQLIYQGFKPKA
jgi:hypothetical protein